MIPLEMAMGLTPAVALKMAPDSPPAAIAPAMSCLPRALSMMASMALYRSAGVGEERMEAEHARLPHRTGRPFPLTFYSPITPALFPMKLPLLVTWFSIALIRKRIVGESTPRGLVNPSRAPSNPPMASPERYVVPVP